MVTFYAISIAIIFLLAFWRKMHQRYHWLVFKYKVYALRDQLRTLAYQGKIDKESWIFEYYDNTFSKAIGKSYYITGFYVSMLAYKYKDDEEFIQLKRKISIETKSNPVLEELTDSFVLAVKKYIREQHFVSITCIIAPILILLYGTQKVTQKFTESAANLLIWPDTSDSKRVKLQLAKA